MRLAATGVPVNPTKFLHRHHHRLPLNSQLLCDRVCPFANEPCIHSKFPIAIRKRFKMGREEQIEEREVLDSIFPEEITGAKERCFDLAHVDSGLTGAFVL